MTACQHQDDPRGCYRVRCQLGRKCVGPMPLRPELRDPSEHLTADDQAALQSAQFAERALLVQRLAASAAPRALPGRCANCGDACMAPAVYCDEDCREDHERRRGRHP